MMQEILQQKWKKKTQQQQQPIKTVPATVVEEVKMEALADWDPTTTEKIERVSAGADQEDEEEGCFSAFD